MAGRDPTRPQLDFPDLVADLITELRLLGQVGLLNFSDQVTPVYIVAARGGSLNVVASQPIFESPAITTGQGINPPANTVVGDTGPLPAGDYDIFASLSYSGLMNITGQVQLQHRDAANAASLAGPLNLAIGTVSGTGNIMLPLIGYSIALNERFRAQILVGNVTGTVLSTIGFRLRPTP